MIALILALPKQARVYYTIRSISLISHPAHHRLWLVLDAIRHLTDQLCFLTGFAVGGQSLTPSQAVH